MAAESWAAAIKSMAPLLAGSIGPLAITTVRHHPSAVALGTVLSLVLGKMTFNLSGVPTKFDTSREQTA
eukprot:COSAG04_NODE_4423_length_2101_cov_2.199800_1_plen_68_part_10